ncbi:DUF7336 domain-containing protein [Paenibacillus apiarius]
MNKVYIVMWHDSFDDWEIKKVFSTSEKAKEFIKDKNPNSWGIFQMEVES